MLSVEEARERIAGHARLTAVERLPLERCAGRVPAAFWVMAGIDVPPFDNSAMDGYAVRAADTPGELPLVGEVAAGAAELPIVAPGTATRILTGAPLPPGADSVVPQELATEADGVVRLPAAVARTHIRTRGEDTRAGDRVELAREPLSAAGLAVLASLGIAELEVRRRPRVALLSTGDELAPVGARLRPGQIHDANAVSLAAAVADAGGEAVPLPVAGDDAETVRQRVSTGVAQGDLLVVSGGVSVGRHDHLRDVIESLGTLDFWRIAVQPGKPLAFGRVGDRPVIGLPGNPVSALVTFELFVRPLLRRMLGMQGDGRLHLRARAAQRIAKHLDRRAYLRVVLTPEGDGWVAHSAGGQGSAQLRGMAAANGLLVIPEGADAAEPGTLYDAVLFGEIR
ncbi:MAG TPA: gephyrin-like molybdotransferase Glp [Candidatus Limnocylindria bacterium]|nr:gephyrin-like molybdotransferase Glp [Candidatus Limnocylindria bacterium]